jgi:diadenosine tetraphosphate (Ap4A) HIT family hydrolase
MAKECDFCNIADEPGRILRRTARVTSFLSNPRLTMGHVLIVPNRHVVRPSELCDEEVLAIHGEVSRVTEVMLGSLSMYGTDEWQKTRPRVPEGTIKRDHLHKHILPSVPGQTLYDQAIDWGGDNWEALTGEELAEMVDVLRYQVS